MYVRLILACALMLTAMTARAQTTINPDVSVIGDFRAFSHSDEARDDERDKVTIADPQLELYLSGYLNPYVRADAAIAWHPGASAELEEIYATVLRGLPLGMNLRLGKYRLEFGRLNPVHPHAYSFIHMPLVHESFFGEEGLNDMALRAAFLLPTGNAYTEVMGAVTKGDALMAHEHDHNEEAEEDESDRSDPGVFGRATTSFGVGAHSELSFGGSALYSVYEPHHHEEEMEEEEEHETTVRALVVGGDTKFKYRPNRYTSVTIEAEALLRRNELPDGDHVNSYGGYGYIDYRFRQMYNVGTIVEWMRNRHEDHEAGEGVFADEDTFRVGLFTGWAPIEETSLVRLAGHWTEPDDRDGFWGVTLQFVFSLGPHQPHNF